MKKLITAAAALLSLCMFAACGGSEPVSAPAADTTSAADVVSVSDAADTDENQPTDNADGTVLTEKITLSGDPDYVFTAERDCYTEGEDVVLYFGKGVAVKGDMLAKTEQIMDELSALTGLDFAKNYDEPDYIEFRNLGMENSSYDHINPNAEKINVVICYNPDNYAVQCAFEDGAVLDELDYDYEATSHQTLYHELAHVIHLRNGADLSRTLCEGYATYTTYHALKAAGIPAWSHIQHFHPMEFDDSIIRQGEDGFRCKFDRFETNYDYGMMLVTFLEETYGTDTFFRIADEAARQGFDSSYDSADVEGSLAEDTAALISIIKTVCGDDVFDRFSEWYDTDWVKHVNSYDEYMEPYMSAI